MTGRAVAAVVTAVMAVWAVWVGVMAWQEFPPTVTVLNMDSGHVIQWEAPPGRLTVLACGRDVCQVEDDDGVRGFIQNPRPKD